MRRIFAGLIPISIVLDELHLLLGEVDKHTVIIGEEQPIDIPHVIRSHVPIEPIVYTESYEGRGYKPERRKPSGAARIKRQAKRKCK